MIYVLVPGQRPIGSVIQMKLQSGRWWRCSGCTGADVKGDKNGESTLATMVANGFDGDSGSGAEGDIDNYVRGGRGYVADVDTDADADSAGDGAADGVGDCAGVGVADADADGFADADGVGDCAGIGAARQLLSNVIFAKATTLALSPKFLFG